MSEFEMELDEIFNGHDMAEHSQQEMLGCGDCYKAIKQAVDKYVIGEVVLPSVQPGFGNDPVIDQKDITKNQLRAEQRQSLWGNPEAGDVI